MSQARLGVVIVSYNSGQEVVDCAETLLGSARAAGMQICVVVVDNRSSDDTVARLRSWADGTAPYAPQADLPFAPAPLAKPLIVEEGAPGGVPATGTDLLILQTGDNRGFAGGVNVGLASLAARPDIGHFWVLNPDSVVPPEALVALSARLDDPPPYALMGGRVIYHHRPDLIQIDGGTIDWRTGATGNLHLGRRHADTPYPDPAQLDFVMGANMIASRAFYERTGPMREEYFLYYEEVDWAMRRGDLPLTVCEGLHIYHHAGTAIGSPGAGRPVSALSVYFKHRGRRMFLGRFRRRAILTSHAYTLWIAARFARHGLWPQALAALKGGFGLAPPRAVADRLGGQVLSRLGRGTTKARP